MQAASKDTLSRGRRYATLSSLRFWKTTGPGNVHIWVTDKWVIINRVIRISNSNFFFFFFMDIQLCQETTTVHITKDHKSDLIIPIRHFY